MRSEAKLPRNSGASAVALAVAVCSVALGCSADPGATSPSVGPAPAPDTPYFGPGPSDDASLPPSVAQEQFGATDSGAAWVLAAGDEAAPDAEGGNAESAPSPPDGACLLTLGPGDLRIDELMIASVAGTGDYGEWLEVESTRDCAVSLQGLHGECPKGAKVVTFDVTEPLWLGPGGTFLVADSLDPTVNHGLSAPQFAWSGRSGDVLRNKGTSVTLMANGTLIDAITYPALPLSIGASMAFPADCDPGARQDWTKWKVSTLNYFPGLFGTPNAPNVDVHCQ